jgi:outer membrane protein assembly factor BamB
VVGDRIFLTYYTGYGPAAREAAGQDGLRLHVLCLARADGRTLWDREVRPELPEQDRIREEHGYASSTPAADSTHVFVFFGRSGVLAFTHDGREVWRTSVGSGLNGWGSAASPVLHKNLVLINASVESESLVALDKKTGTEVWRAGGVKEAWNTPLVIAQPGGKTEVVVPIVKQVLAFDPDDGKALWQSDTDIAWYMCPSSVAHEGVVYSIGGRTGGGLAIRTGGRGNVTASHELWRLNKGSNVSSPIYHDGHVYFAHENLGIAYCVEAGTGKLVYDERLSPSPGMIYASPVLADGKIYYLSREGRAYVVAAKPRFELLAQNNFERRDMFNASPAITGNRLLIRSDKFLYCIGK